MPFGKHKDVELGKVPRPYLRWLRRQPWLGGWLVREIDLALSGEADESFEEALRKWKDENLTRQGGGSEQGEK
jgi:uncharacterized protein (DUF3820 family)